MDYKSMQRLKVSCTKHKKQDTVTLMNGTSVCSKCCDEFDKERQHRENTIVYEGIIAEQQGNVLCMKYKEYEANKIGDSNHVQKVINFFTRYRQKGTIKLADDALDNIKPYSLEGKKARVWVQILEY